MATSSKQVVEETMAIINSALTILDNFPEVENPNMEFPISDSFNPIEIILEMLKQTEGYDKIIEILARFIAQYLPYVEASMKSLLISQLTSMLSCSVNPLLTKQLLTEGVFINLDEIDIADVLKYSPLDNKMGSYFYFGTDGISVGDLEHADDMDAFLWFIVNKANRRFVWRPLEERLLLRTDNSWLNEWIGNGKSEKRDGIITFEYHEKGENVRDAYGNTLNRQVPYNNCLHVFIGNAREINGVDELKKTEESLETVENEIDNLNDQIENQELKKQEIEEERNKLNTDLANGSITSDQYKTWYEKYSKQLKDTDDNLKRKIDSLIEQQNQKTGLQFKIGELNLNLLQLGQNAFLNGLGLPIDNYYFGHPLLEFNIDYIMSLKFYDEKVLAARLLESLTGVLSIDFGISFKRELVRNEVRKMVKKIIETDDTVISDCFFTFSNSEYDAMEQQAELRKAGLLSMDGSEDGVTKLNPEEILSRLNEINEASDVSGMVSAIKGTFRDLSRDVTESSEYELKGTTNAFMRLNFIEKILDHLAYVLVSAVISPKVYLIILINLKIMGREANFSLEQFIGSFKNLIASIIRMIRDMLIEYLITELMKIIEGLAKEIAQKIAIEQALYYKKLIKRLIDCWRKNRFNLDWVMDNVDYADILSDGDSSEPENAEC